MTTFSKIKLVCPLCDTEFESTKVEVYESVKPKRTDFYERVRGEHYLQTLVHTCTECLYTAAIQAFTDDEYRPELNSLEKDVLRTLLENAWAGEGKRTTGSSKYYLAAVTAAHMQVHPKEIGDLYQYAAWCASEEADTEAERFYQGRANSWFIEAMRGYGLVAPEYRATLTYLVGENFRRMGRLKDAQGWFDAVEHEIVDTKTQNWLVQVAKQQATKPQEFFGPG